MDYVDCNFESIGETKAVLPCYSEVAHLECCYHFPQGI